ncbi:hypothetical protein AVEN_90108-1 [Araneus ventricosus]|uniref:Uncharacterized protein n=1 Tax=Araneus ventricosus TaxID=182803 RepID=A0A4Y2P8Y7_ARAVE|nr:hypothetical protein AVEN_90108-1 [Araneus ventricosus]
MIIQKVLNEKCQEIPPFIEMTLSSSVIISSPTALSQLPNKEMTTKETWRTVSDVKEVSNQQHYKESEENTREKPFVILIFLVIFSEFPESAALSPLPSKVLHHKEYINLLCVKLFK